MRPLSHTDLDHVLAHTRPLWEAMRGKSLFVTGGTGFFGCWLVESFLHVNEHLGLDARITVLSRDPEAFLTKMPHLVGRPGLDFVRGDVRDFSFPPGRFDAVIHAATESSAKLNIEEPLHMVDTIVAGTRRTLDFSVKAGVQRFLLTSSGAVYGRQPPEMTHISEDYFGAPDPLDSKSAYGEGKRMAEHLCMLYASQHRFEATIARCFAFVGPHLPLDGTYAIGNFIRDALSGQPISVQGDGTPYRSYLYAADLAVWLWTILFKGSSARAYNVGSSDAVSIKELAQEVALVLGGDVRVAREPPMGAVRERYVPDNRRVSRELNLTATIDRRSAILRTALWHGYVPRSQEPDFPLGFDDLPE